MDLDARPYLGESATQSGFFCHQDSDHLAATAQHGPEDLGVGIAQRAQRRGGPPPQQASYTPPFGGLGVREPVFQFEFPSPKGGGPIEGAAKGQQIDSKRAARDWTFPSPKGGGPIEGEQMQKPRTGRERTGGAQFGGRDVPSAPARGARGQHKAR